MFPTMTSIFIIVCLCRLLLVKLQVPDASLVVFLITELLAAMPNQNIIINNNKSRNLIDPNFSNPYKRTENGQKTGKRTEKVRC